MSMSEAEGLQKLGDVIRAQFDQPDLPISRDTTADNVAGWDSIAHAMLLMNIEIDFDIRFDPSEVLDLEMVGDLLNVVLRKVNQ